MRNFLMLIVALIIVYAVWNLVLFFIGTLVAMIIKISLLLLFCYAVYAVYKLLTRDRSRC